MVFEPVVPRRPWQTLIRRWLRETGRILAVSLLGGLLSGLGLALSDLSDFSYLPDFFGYAMALVVGGYIGSLTRELGQGLVALLLVILLSAGVSTLALAYPELQANHLGLEVAIEVSTVQALTGSIFSVPFLIIGLLIGKWLARFE